MTWKPTRLRSSTPPGRSTSDGCPRRTLRCAPTAWRRSRRCLRPRTTAAAARRGSSGSSLPPRQRADVGRPDAPSGSCSRAGQLPRSASCRRSRTTERTSGCRARRRSRPGAVVIEADAPGRAGAVGRELAVTSSREMPPAAKTRVTFGETCIRRHAASSAMVKVSACRAASRAAGRSRAVSARRAFSRCLRSSDDAVAVPALELLAARHARDRSPPTRSRS